jgi:hypothetical protein
VLLGQASSYSVLPAPSAFEFYFFESPWQFLALLMVCGLVLLYQANQVRSKRFMYWGSACIALGVLVLILATCVTTRREILIARTKDFINHTAPLNAPAILPFLTSDCAFYASPQATTPTVTVKEVDNFAKGKVVDFIDAQSIVRLDVSIDSPTAGRSQLWLRTYVKASLMNGEALPVSSRWELQWVLENGVWKVASVRLLERD